MEAITIGNLFAPESQASIAKATGDIRSAIDLNASVWLDLLKMARNILLMIPVPSIYLSLAIGGLDLLIGYLAKLAA
jgi:hypothetical protein